MWLLSVEWISEASPARAAWTRLPASARDRPSDSLRDARVLVVEDEFIVAALLEDRLVQLGCLVVGPASDIEEALELLASERVDAAVLDVNIAGRMVYPVADALVERSVPFLFATAYGREGVADRHAERTVLNKPYDDSAFERALRATLLERSRN
jgi:CheY-like chemotaxis protein